MKIQVFNTTYLIKIGSFFFFVTFLVLTFSTKGVCLVQLKSLPDSTEKSDNGLELEINGLLVDETQSKTAKEFYDLFYAQWNAPLLELQYSIVFSEKPMPRFGTLITITINEQAVFSRFVQPRYERIEEMSREALKQTFSYLDNYAQIQQQLKFDEMQGNGIY